MGKIGTTLLSKTVPGASSVPGIFRGLVTCNGGIGSVWLALRADCFVAVARKGIYHCSATAPRTRRE